MHITRWSIFPLAWNLGRHREILLQVQYYYFATRSSVGPTMLNDQEVTAQTWFYPNGETQVTYWKVTDTEVTYIVDIHPDDVIETANPPVFPENMQVGQFAYSGDIRYTFAGFETINLGGRTFSASCHLVQEVVTSSGEINHDYYPVDIWFAPGYGIVKQAWEGETIQYDGDIGLVKSKTPAVSQKTVLVAPRPPRLR
jgi:hypothetical protein